MSETDKTNMEADMSFVSFLKGEEEEPVSSQEAPSNQPPVQEEVQAPPKEVAPRIEPLETTFFSLDTPTDESDLNDFNILASKIKEKYGAEVKEPKDILSVLGKIDELSGLQASYEEKLKQMSIYEQTIVNLPDDLKSLVYDWANGNDYKKTINDIVKGSRLDYSKDASSYDADYLISFYNPDISKEDLEELDAKVKATLHSNALRQYNSDKVAIIEKDKRIQQQTEQRKQEFASSVEDSIAELKRKYPQFSASKINEIKDRMITGYSLYDNGKYSRDAAVKIAMAEYGEDALNKMKMSLEQRYSQELKNAVSKERETYVMHQNDRPTMPSSESYSNDRSKKVEEITSFLRKKETFI